MTLRIFFEPHEKMCINDIDVFKYYGENYLVDFNIEFGGRISMNAIEKVIGRLEPVWQFIMFDSSKHDTESLIQYVQNNPMNGYYIHMYVDRVGKIY